MCIVDTYYIQVYTFACVPQILRQDLQIHTETETYKSTRVYLEILFWEGNMVDKDSKKGHNTLLCAVGAFATSHPQ